MTRSLEKATGVHRLSIGAGLTGIAEGATMIDPELIPAHERTIHDWFVIEATARQAIVAIHYPVGLNTHDELLAADARLDRAHRAREAHNYTRHDYTVVTGAMAVTVQELERPEHSKRAQVSAKELAEGDDSSEHTAPWRAAALRAARGLLGGAGVSFLTLGDPVGLDRYQVTACDKDGYALASLLVTVE